MKKSNILILLILVFVNISCLNKVNLSQRTYHFENEYRTESIKFIDKKTCILKQSLKCDFKSPYDSLIIKCNYKYKKGKLIFDNKFPLDSLKGKYYLRIERDIWENCIIMNRYKKDPLPTVRLMIAPPCFEDGVYEAFYNYFDKAEFIYQDSIIFYKCFLAFPEGILIPRTTPYVLNNIKIDSTELERRILEISTNREIKSNRIPYVLPEQ